MERLPPRLRAFVELMTRPPSRYRFFQSLESRLELMDIIRGLTDRLVETRTENLVLVDRAARPLAVGLSAYWRNMSSPPSTSMYFLNPLGFQSQEFVENVTGASERLTAKVVMTVAKATMGFLDEDPVVVSAPGLRSDSDVRRDFRNSMPSLYRNREKKTAVFDTCIHNGYWLKPIINTLHSVGFVDVETLVVNDHSERRWSLMRSNGEILPHEPSKVCYPFDNETLVCKNTGSVHSTRTSIDTIDGVERIERGVSLRREIRQIVDEYAASPRGLN